MKRSTIAVIAAILVTAFVLGQAPQTAPVPPEGGPPSETAATPTDAVPQLTAEDLTAFLDGIVPQQLDRENIAGATVSVVKDGKILFAKGYGYSDVKTKAPVSPEKTLFRPGSVSKLFTWTAVMQMHEQGKLDLDRDVNEYIDFKIPDAFGKPITMRHILTHTPGFEEQIKDLFSTVPTTDLGGYLKTHIPARIFPPGTTPAYSNYATALAGYVVERISGVPFTQYVDENILKPLGMVNSTFAQPLPDHLAPNMSKGYRLASDDPLDFEMVSAFPAGSMSSSATDMANFMLAHLQDGKLGEASILKPETTKQMHERLFGLDPAAPGMAHGFYEESQNGMRIIGHGGDTIAFHSDLHLIPEKGIGFFISYNSLGKGEAPTREMIWTAILDRYFPYTKPAGDPAGAEEEIQKIAGNYMVSRRSETSFFRLASLLGQASVVPNADGTISIPALTGSNGQPKRWERIRPMTFRDVNGQDLLIFKPDANGEMQIVLPYPFMTFTQVGLADNGTVLMPVLVISLSIMGMTLLLAPIAWIIRRRYGQRLAWTAKELWTRRAVWGVFALNLISVIAMAGLLTYALSNIDFFGEKGKVWFWVVQIVGILGALGTLVVIYNAFLSWKRGTGIWRKILSTVLVLACFGFLWFGYAANLFVLRSTY
ncbi:MAG: serine hydrolase [Pyrinomonadaceae bacterium]